MQLRDTQGKSSAEHHMKAVVDLEQKSNGRASRQRVCAMSEVHVRDWKATDNPVQKCRVFPVWRPFSETWIGYLSQYEPEAGSTGETQIPDDLCEISSRTPHRCTLDEQGFVLTDNATSHEQARRAVQHIFHQRWLIRFHPVKCPKISRRKCKTPHLRRPNSACKQCGLRLFPENNDRALNSKALFWKILGYYLGTQWTQ